jgi:alcohol dehydrogenase (cytochrome c)
MRLRVLISIFLVGLFISVTAVTVVGPVRWRAVVILRHLEGESPEFTLWELTKMLLPHSGYYLEQAAEGRSMGAIVENPFQGPEVVVAGARLFAARCSSCHGSEGTGGVAPPFRGQTMRHGNTDLAMLRNIRHGITGTSMSPSGLDEHDSWTLVAYIRSLQKASRLDTTVDATRSTVLDTYHGVASQELLHAGDDASEWRTYSRTYDGWRFSPLSQIDKTNIRRLRLLWLRQLPTAESVVESTPISVDGVIFVVEPPNIVHALDARSGVVLWTYHRELPERLNVCCGNVNRGVGVLEDKVFIGTLDAHVVALQARTGKILWDVAVGTPEDGYSITGAPLIVGDMVVTGVSGGEFGIKGFILALDTRTGKTRWRFDTVPQPGQRGVESWSGNSWTTGGGPAWITGGYDPKLDLIYWGIGNPGPVYEGAAREGDNLYTDSVVALQAKTGQLSWYFQFTPHDVHDWDSTQVPVQVDVPSSEGSIPALAWANRNGYFYLLNRKNGEFIRGVPFVRQTWADGLGPKGRPILRESARVTPQGTLTFPGVAGGTTWQSPSFDPRLQLFFVHAVEGSSIFTNTGKTEVVRRRAELFVGSSGITQPDRKSYVRALEVRTGNRLWEYHSGGPGFASGLLSTAGDLVLGSAQEHLFALDSATGKELMRVPLGGLAYAGPITYALDDKQYLLVVAGRSIMAFGL